MFIDMYLVMFISLLFGVFHCSKLLSTFSSEPTCLVVSSDEQLMVVGTGQGMLHVINTQSGQV